ncbi:MAG: phage tail tube protein, partial [Lactococcus garvieae]
LRVNNETWTEVTAVTADIEIARDDVQFGLGKDSKIIGLGGSGTITVDKVFSRFLKDFVQMAKGKDIRFDLYLKVSDPDAVDGQIETVSLKGCWLNKLPLGFGEKSAKITGEYEFGFDPTKTSFADTIN